MQQDEGVCFGSLLNIKKLKIKIKAIPIIGLGGL
jgi:hypothetical protein